MTKKRAYITGDEVNWSFYTEEKAEPIHVKFIFIGEEDG